MALARIALVAALLAASGATCQAPNRTAVRGPVPVPPPQATGPHALSGEEMAVPTGLRLVVEGNLIDVDSAAVQRIGVTGWVWTADRRPVLLEEVRHAEDRFEPLKASPKREPNLPGNPTVTRLEMDGSTVVAAGRDGSLWAMEYKSRTICTLRRIGEAERLIPCGTRPIAETPHGLWVTEGVNQDRAVLLDPATLAERMSFPYIALVDEHRFVSWGPKRDSPVRLHDLRTNETRPARWPDFHGWDQPQVIPASPDGRWLAFRFGDPGRSPQVQDVWLLDLQELRWVHPPDMPVLTALKSGGIAWAADGRLVMLGRFYDAPDRSRLLVAVWRPGLARWMLKAVPQTGPFVVITQ